MTDTSQIASQAPAQPNEINPLASADMPRGTPVYHNNNTVIPGRANAIGTARLVGITASAGVEDEPVRVKYAGPVTLETAEWDALTGGSGGLTENATYYLSTSEAGKYQTNLPANPNYVAKIGTAISTRTMMVQVEGPTLGLGG
jgi:hypothetical protein